MIANCQHNHNWDLYHTLIKTLTKAILTWRFSVSTNLCSRLSLPAISVLAFFIFSLLHYYPFTSRPISVKPMLSFFSFILPHSTVFKFHPDLIMSPMKNLITTIIYP